MNRHFNEVAKRMEQLGRRYDLSAVFNDLLTMAVCSYHRTNIQSRLTEKDPANEKIYLHISGRYDKTELKSFSEILGHLMLNAAENPYSDILGEYFMEHISRGQNGQFFTPDPVCKMMAMFQGEDETVTGKKVMDPACGSGRMLLQFAKLHPDNYFFGADNSSLCAKMAVLNFFLNGLRGEIAWMNSLSMEWFAGWHINMDGPGILPIANEQSFIWSEPPPPQRPVLPPLKESAQDKTTGIQLTLF